MRKIFNQEKLIQELNKIADRELKQKSKPSRKRTPSAFAAVKKYRKDSPGTSISEAMAALRI